MPRVIHKPIAWLLIGILSIVAGVGEGLHWLPGCGHGIEIGDRVFLLGINLPEDTRPPDNRTRAERPSGQDIPIEDEYLCAICSIVGQSCTSAAYVQFVLVLPLAHNLTTVIIRNALGYGHPRFVG